MSRKRPLTPQELLAQVDRAEAKKTAKTTAPQNRAISGGGRAPNGRFCKGSSGNPGGRPQGLLEHVREATDNGLELVDILLAIARREMTVKRMTPEGLEVDVEPSIKEVTEAAKGLLAIFPKPPTEVSVGGPAGVVLDGLKELSGEKLLELVRSEAPAPARVANLDE